MSGPLERSLQILERLAAHPEGQSISTLSSRLVIVTFKGIERPTSMPSSSIWSRKS